MSLLFWRSLESLMKEFSGTEHKRLEETFVTLVNVIKQSPYLDLERCETEGMCLVGMLDLTKRFSSQCLNDFPPDAIFYSSG